MNEKIWEIGFKDVSNKICLIADDIDSAISKALEYASKELEIAKKDTPELDESEFADMYVIESVVLLLKTDY